MTTSYDTIPYPTGLIAAINPERHAVLARLAGLDPVIPSRARILEIGGGDCLNLLAMATAWPGCEAHGFDLSETAIARGRRLVDAAGLTNVQLVVEDIVAATRRYPARAFDYVIAHGVYAWVPPDVREATMALIGHALSDRGVAFVSYNAMPGCHVRLMMREMLLDALQDVEGMEAQCEAVRALLETFRVGGEDEGPLLRALRKDASRLLGRPDAVLFHDELGDDYHPQLLGDVVAAGDRHGLAWLTDATRGLRLEGFVANDAAMPPDPDRAVLRAATASDFPAMRSFRQSLFVRSEAQRDRRLDPARVAGLWLSTRLEPAGERTFRFEGQIVRLGDAAFSDTLARAAGVWPQRIPVSEFASTSEALGALVRLFGEGLVNLYTVPAPFAERSGQTPCVSALARAMIAAGLPRLCNLEHAMVHVEEPALRTLLALADGSRSLAQVAALQFGIPGGDVQRILDDAARQALLC